MKITLSPGLLYRQIGLLDCVTELVEISAEQAAEGEEGYTERDMDDLGAIRALLEQLRATLQAGMSIQIVADKDVSGSQSDDLGLTDTMIAVLTILRRRGADWVAGAVDKLVLWMTAWVCPGGSSRCSQRPTTRPPNAVRHGRRNMRGIRIHRGELAKQARLTQLFQIAVRGEEQVIFKPHHVGIADDIRTLIEEILAKVLEDGHVLILGRGSYPDMRDFTGPRCSECDKPMLGDIESQQGNRTFCNILVHTHCMRNHVSECAECLSHLVQTHQQRAEEVA